MQRDSLHPEPKPKLAIELFCVLMTKWKELARLAWMMITLQILVISLRPYEFL